MIQYLMIFEVLLAIFMIFIILIQNKNVSLNLTSMSWWMWSITKRWPEKVLHNLTIILGTLFVLNSLLLFLYK